MTNPFKGALLLMAALIQTACLTPDKGGRKILWYSMTVKQFYRLNLDYRGGIPGPSGGEKEIPPDSIQNFNRVLPLADYLKGIKKHLELSHVLLYLKIRKASKEVTVYFLIPGAPGKIRLPYDFYETHKSLIENYMLREKKNPGSLK